MNLKFLNEFQKINYQYILYNLSFIIKNVFRFNF